MPGSLAEMRDKWSRAADEDPRLLALLRFLAVVGAFLLCALLTFCRIRLRAWMRTKHALLARDLEAVSSLELEPMREAQGDGLRSGREAKASRAKLKSKTAGR